MISAAPRSIITTRASVLLKQAVRHGFSANLSASSRGALPLVTKQTRGFSAKAPAPLEADSGGLATHVHHAMTLGLAVATPVYFLIPESYANSAIGTAFGLAWVTTVTAHSWIGLNYVW